MALVAVPAFTWACADGAPEVQLAVGTAVAEVSAPEATPEGMDHSAHMPGDMAVLEGDGPWTQTSTLGSHVTLTLGPAPFSAGPIAVGVSVHAMTEGAAVTSIDLVSPTMPMHGIVRVPVTDGEAHMVLPMEGAWALYVNLDAAGSDSAEFLFAVTAGALPDGSH
jgi:hypothetical protein